MQTSTGRPKRAGCRKTRTDNDRISGQTEGKGIIQDYVNRMYNQFVVDPNTNEPKRMLDYPSSELVTKLVTFSYDSI